MVGLKLQFAPFQPSNLRHTSGPQSPASPLEPSSKRIRSRSPAQSSNRASESIWSPNLASEGPPPDPCRWMWYCHQCRTGYGIGVTRRCLLDDHLLCYGQPVRKRTKKGIKVKKVKACQSEFDYVGWQKWGEWKRSQIGQYHQSQDQPARHCSLKCDWPSQCRWAPDLNQPDRPDNERDHQESSLGEPPPKDEEPSTESDDNSLARQTGTYIEKIYTATQKLTSQWTSLLTPIQEQEEEQSCTGADEFLKLGRSRPAMPMTTEPQTKLLLRSGIPQIGPLAFEKDKTDIWVEPDSHHPSSSTLDDDEDAPFDFGFERTLELTSPKAIDEGISNRIAQTIVSGRLRNRIHIWRV